MAVNNDAAWNMMYVGPIREGDEISGHEGRVCRVLARGNLQNSTPEGGHAASSMAKEAHKCAASDLGLRGSNFYFGTSTAVMEGDGKGWKYWIREECTRTMVRWGLHELEDVSVVFDT
ncbi:unnamed protein product [Calypogeia fissa]